MSLNYIDYFVLVILVLFAIRGYFKGVIIGLATIGALVLGVYIATRFSWFFDKTLMEYLHPSPRWLHILSFTVTFLLVVLIVILVAKLTERFVSVIGMGFFNHLGGALLGIAKGAILVSILIFLLIRVDPAEKWIPAKDKKASYCYERIGKVFPGLMKTLGEENLLPGW
jgi:membrane protein required for colicin V production